MANLNEVMLLGRLGATPEIKQGKDGSAFGTISVATNSKKKTAEGKYEDVTEWHKVALYGQNAEFAAEYLEKGSQVLIKGRLRTRSYEKDGETKYITEVSASNLQGISSAKSE